MNSPPSDKDVQTLNADLIKSGDLLYWSLKNRQCTCSYNVPYKDGHIKQEKMTTCLRCENLADWERIAGDPNSRREL